ncbi:MAG: hypothetical protein GY803_24545, partial [Chloroflexi bacterium]|nr:hypothetical protein [Chloroflexota bacterium]
MAKIQVEEMEVEEGNGIPKMILGNAHKLFQASLGAVMMVQDEVVGLTNKLIEQGESTEQKSRKRVDSFVDERKKETKKLTKRAEKNWNKQMETILHRVNVPTRAEI